MIIAMLFNATTFVTVFVVLLVSFIILLAIVLPLLFIVPTITNWRQNCILRQTGEPAQAKILKIWDTGISVNDNPQVGMLLEVYAKDRLPFEAETKSIVSRLHIPLVQVGSIVEVRFDQQDASKVALVM